MKKMHFDQILVIKETGINEKRVALTPEAVALLVSKGYRIFVEENAGLNAGFSNADYTKVGGKIFSLTSSGFPPNTFIVRVLWDKVNDLVENKYFHENTAILGFIFPFMREPHIKALQWLRLTTLSFDLFKSLSIHDSKNALAAMSRITGRLALQDALKKYCGEKPVKLTVVGPGAAGVSAAYEALKQNIPVQVFGRKESHRAELEKAGITYYVLRDEAKQINFIQAHLAEATIVITAARIPGKKAPLLLDKESLSLLPSKAVVIDLAASNGGNVAGSQYDQTIIVENGVSIISVAGYPKLEPKSSSEIYARCVVNFLTETMSPKGDISFDNELVQEIWMTHGGQRNDSLYGQLDTVRHRIWDKSPGQHLMSSGQEELPDIRARL